MSSSEAANRLKHEFLPVELEGPLLPASEDETTEVEHSLREPINEKVSKDSVFHFGKESSEEYLSLEDFPGCVDSHIQTGYGMLLPDITREWSDESKFGYLDGMLQGGYEEDFYVNGLSRCDDFLLGNLGFESCSSRMRDRDTSSAGMSELSSTAIPLSESTSDQNILLLNKMNIHELHDTFRSTFGRETTVKDKQWLIKRISFGLQNFLQFKNDSSILESEIFCKKQNGGMLFESKNGSPKIYSTVGSMKDKPTDQTMLRDKLAGVDVYNTNYSEVIETGVGKLSWRGGEGTTRKRSRKPTRRYIEEISDTKSRLSSGKLDTTLTGSKDKFMLDRLYDQHNRKEFKSTPLIRNHDSFVNSDTQENDSGDDNNERLLLDNSHSSDMESSSTESEYDISDDCVSTVRTRRKRHTPWTLSEVMTLVDGVSQYGVGRWTKLKRLLFTSSAYRTSVDLKDKWRNLLRASSGAQLEDKSEGRNGTSRLIPQSVLRRVRELAIIYPYPRQRKSMLPPELRTMSSTSAAKTHKKKNR